MARKKRRTSHLSRNTKSAQRIKKRRANETPEQKAERLKKYRENVYKKRHNETPEQKAERLKIYRIRTKQIRNARKTHEARMKRLEILKEVAERANSNSNKDGDDDLSDPGDETALLPIQMVSVSMDTGNPEDNLQPTSELCEEKNM